MPAKAWRFKSSPAHQYSASSSMGLENFEEKKNESIPGKGFVMRGKPYTSSDFSVHPIEAKPGESNEKELEESKAGWQKELERTKDFTAADFIEDSLRSMLKGRDSYSETFVIEPNGKFGDVRHDGAPRYLEYGGTPNTPEEFYHIAKEIEKKYPEYHFNFEADTEGKWMKYTVSKGKSEK